jgi:hypothetical protein
MISFITLGDLENNIILDSNKIYFYFPEATVDTYLPTIDNVSNMTNTMAG